MRPSFANLFGAFCLAAVGTAGCTATGDAAGQSEGAVTDIPETMFRNQKDTGNCWLYATAAWIESLEYGALIAQGKAQPHEPTTAPRHISPAYWDYWDWYAKITGGTLDRRGKQALRDQLDSGGSWGAAVEIVARYGLMRSRAFVTRGVKEADLTLGAREAIVTSLTSGELRTQAARRDRELVRRELNAAFQLDEATALDLQRAFGDGTKSFGAGARATDTVVDPQALLVRLPKALGGHELRPLTDAIGARAAGDNPDRREGAWAWNVVPFEAHSPAETRAYFKRLQRALHAGVPLPISWYAASNGDPDGDGAYRAVPEEPANADESGGHETVLDDYEVEVPGVGRLAAGTPATDAQKEAALADDARVVFLRVKNSWGGRTGETRAPAGYNDLYVEFLTGTVRACPAGARPSSRECTDEVPLEDVTLPAGF